MRAIAEFKVPAAIFMAYLPVLHVLRMIRFLVFLVLASGMVAPRVFSQYPQSDETSSQKMPTPDELFLFVPSKYPEGEWNPKNLVFQDVYFQAEDGVKLHGWYCRSANARATMLVAHGNAGNVANRVAWLEYLQNTANVSVFMFDYRGYGRSEGKPSVAGIIKDARAAKDQLCTLANIQESDVVLMGESLGGAVVIQLAAESPVRAIILQSTFSSFRDVAAAHSRFAWLIPKSKLNSVDAITRYHGPVFQSHGDSDSVVPFALGKRIFDAAHEPKTWYTVCDADHNDWLTEDYLNQFNAFLDSLSRK